MKNKLVIIFAESGFLEQYVVQELAKLGYTINVITRTPSQKLYLKTAGQVGQINISYFDISNEDRINQMTKNSYAVINLIDVNPYDEINLKFPKILANFCIEHKVKKFIHLSAMGIESSTSKYLKSKLEMENSIMSINPDVYIIRTNFIFGHEDNFFNLFARITNFSPLLPSIGSGKAKLQPVYVVDIAQAIVKLIENDTYENGIYELAGNEVISFKDILKFILNITKRKRCIVDISFTTASIIAKIMRYLPFQLWSYNQVESLKSDCLLTHKYKTFRNLGMIPAKFEHIVPHYLSRFK